MADLDSDARRTQTLEALLSRSISVDSAAALLSQEPWDSDLPLVTLSAAHLESELRRFLDGELSAQDVGDWANFFEVRDDVEFDNETAKAIVFELANPCLREP